MSSFPRAKSYGSIVGFVAAVGFAVHLLGSETTSTRDQGPATAPAEPPPAETEPEAVAPAPPEPTRRDVQPAAPRVEELESQLADDPEAVLRSLTRVLPKGEREEQRLKVLEVQALVKNGRIGAARGRASDYFERWPNGPDTATLEGLTGMHPRNDRVP